MQELEYFTVSVRESKLSHLQDPVLQGYQKKILQIWFLTLIMRFHKLPLTVNTSIRSSKSAKKQRVSILDSRQRLSHGPQLRERDLLLPSVRNALVI